MRAKRREEGRELEFLRDSSGFGDAPKKERSATTYHSAVGLFETFALLCSRLPPHENVKYLDVRG